MRVVVDRDLCEANGVCAGLAPGVFDLDDEDYLNISPGEVPAASEDLVRRAVASCPRLALSLAD
jgi:ferredoxin